MEENLQENISYKEDLLELKNSIEVNNNTLNDIKVFLETEKKEKEEQAKKDLETETIEKKELEKNEQEQQEQLQQFYSDIKEISENTSTEVTTQMLSDVSTLIQANIMGIGLIIGILCVSLLAKFFRR